MKLEDFSAMVMSGSSILRSACPSGDPTEAQVKQATKEAGLTATNESDSYVVDPVRFAVFVNAYKPRLKAEFTPEAVIERAWKWIEHQPQPVS